MSTHKGGVHKRQPAHQNDFAFKHNKGSKKSAKIKEMPISGVCKHCFEKLTWKKKYRKYKPLSAPAKCKSCLERNVKAAYHHYCRGCAEEKKACPACCEVTEIYMSNKKKKAMVANESAASAMGVDASVIEKLLKGEKLALLSERERRSAIRKALKGRTVKKAGGDGEEGGGEEDDEESYDGEEMEIEGGEADAGVDADDFEFEDDEEDEDM